MVLLTEKHILAIRKILIPRINKNVFFKRKFKVVDWFRKITSVQLPASTITVDRE